MDTPSNRCPAQARLVLAVGLFLGSWAWVPAEEPAREPTVKVCKFNDLKKAIADQKGKVLIVDVWSDTCTPCKEEFPRLVRLHEKHAKDGLVAMSIALDPPSNAKRMNNVRTFLKQQKAHFDNFVLDEELDFIQEKLGISGPPVIFVFGRDGKLVKKFDPVDDKEGDRIYDKVEKLVPELLKTK